MSNYNVAVVYADGSGEMSPDVFDTLESAVELARDTAGEVVSHLFHEHVLPNVQVFDLSTLAVVWEWCPPSFSTGADN
jgi:hypothetical protein